MKMLSRKYTGVRLETPIALTAALLLLIIASILIAGCGIHRPLSKKKSINVPARYSTGHGEETYPGRWWEEFGDDNLNRLIDEAFRNNPDIAQAYARLMESEAILNKASAVRGIGIDINASGGKVRQNGLSGPVRAETYTLSSAARYELDIWGKLRASSSAAAHDLQASREDLQTLFVGIAARVADLYFLAVEQKAQLELADRIIEAYRDILDRVEERYFSGLVPAIDVYQSRQNLATAEARRSLFRSHLAVTLNALSVLAGRFGLGKMLSEETGLPDGPSIEAGVPSQLLTMRPDIKAALARLRAADERIAVAVADRFPSFTFSATYGGSSDRVKTVLDDPNIFWNILMQAVQPLIDSGLRKADRTRAVYMERLAAYHATVLKAYSEVEDALARIEATTERIRGLEKLIDASDDSLRLAIDRYMQGITDYLPVLTEQTRNYNAKSDLLSTRRQLISDRISLARALGGRWTVEVTEKYLSEKGKFDD
jgi:NodT family efflux transporter outer membrane factor (OMF) lipoprotein